MHKKLLLVLFLFFNLVGQINAQQRKVKGVFVDSTNNKRLENVVVMAINPKDSSLVQFQRTNKNGEFELTHLMYDSIKIHATTPGYADFVDVFKIEGETLNIGNINFTQLSQLIEAVFIKAQGGKMKFKGDTLVYLADSFKTRANATVEDLIKKLPGLQVKKTGEITAQGKKVERVLVDGEEFFGDDPTVATRNLDAKSVKEVTVYDAQSEEAKRTGDVNAEKVKTLDIKLKEEAKKGYFGKISTASSLDLTLKNPSSNLNLYEQRALFSSFNKKRKFSLFGLRGNTAKVGMNWDETNQFGEEKNNWYENGMYFSSDNNQNDLNYSSSSGVPKSMDLGGLYSNQWEKHKLNMNLSFRSLDIYNRNTTKKIQLLTGNELWNFTENKDTNKRYQLSSSVKWTYDLDSSNNLIVNLKGSLGGTNRFTNFNTNSSYLNIDTLNKQLRNGLDSNVNFAYSGELKYNHKFQKKGRTLGVTANYSNRKQDGSNSMNSLNSFKYNGGFNSYSLQQLRNNNTKSQNVAATLNYTEPLSKNLGILSGFQYSNSKQWNLLNVFSCEGQSVRVDSLGNDYMLGQTQISGNLGMQWHKKKWNVSIGIRPQLSTLVQSEKIKVLALDKSYSAFLPNAAWNWNFSKMGSIHLEYTSSVTLPSVSDLQPILNNSNPLYLNKGNIELTQGLSHNYNLWYHNGNILRQSYFYLSGNHKYFASNFITSTEIDSLGRTISTTVMGKNNSNTSIYGNYQQGIKGTPLGLNLGFSYYQSLSQAIQNRQLGENFFNSLNLNPSIYLELGNIFSIDLDYEFTRNYNSSSFNKDFSNTNWVQSLSVELSIGPINKTTFSADDSKKDEDNGWSLSVDYEGNYRQQTSIYNVPNNKLINGKISYTYKKKREFIVSLDVNDLLNQNINYSRYVTGNQIFETTNTAFKRYFLLNLTYKFKSKPKTDPTKTNDETKIND